MVEDHSPENPSGTNFLDNVDINPTPEGLVSNENAEGGLEVLKDLKQKYINNPCMGYLNINSLRGQKFTDLKEILRDCPLEILCIDETRLNSNFTTAQFHINGYQYPPFRRDRDTDGVAVRNSGGGKMIFIKEGIICKRLEKYETENAESICLQLIFKNKKWFILFGYRPESIDRRLFFEEINKTLSSAVNNYENIIVAGDLNIDLSQPNNDTNHYLSDLCDTFDLKNLVNVKTCYKSKNGSSIDVLLTNRPRSFYKTVSIETGLSDHHTLIATFFRSHYQRLPPKNIKYRDTKNLDNDSFLNDVKNINLDELSRFVDPFTGFLTLYKCIVDRHCPIKSKKIRGNDQPFMNHELRKAIMDRSRIRNKYNKWKSRENYLDLQNIKKKCKSLAKKAKHEHFNKVLSNNNMTNKDFWKLVKPALSDKNCDFGSTIILNEDGILVSSEKELVEIFNSHYVKIVENTTGTPPSSIETGWDENHNKESLKPIIAKILEKFKNHPSIKSIEEHNPQIEEFKIPLANKADINKLIKNINTKKSPGPDLILPSLVKMSADIIDEPLSNIINSMITNCIFSDTGKVAHVTPIYKKKARDDKVNYRPVSVIGSLSKIVERYVQDTIAEHMDKCLSIFISAYRKRYSSNHVLIRLLESWKKHMDNKKFVGAVLMDLSKAFDCVPHDLLIAKMHAYGFDLDTLTFFYSYLKNRKQSVKVNNVLSTFLVLVSGVPQGSILGPIFFNLFINDLIYFLNKSDCLNFADDNTLSAFANTIPELIHILESESDIAINWFRENDMIVNPDKFQAIVINRKPTDNSTFLLNFDSKNIETTSEVTLLGIDIDNNLTFNSHIHNLTKRAAGQLNYLCSNSRYLNLDAKRILVESFILANFNYCPLVWYFCSSESKRKQEQIQKRALRFLFNDYESDYEHLLVKANKPTLEIRKIRLLALEIFKTIQGLNPTYMKEIFIQNTRRGAQSNKLYVQSQNSKKYGSDTLRSLGPKIWNSLPIHFREATSLCAFKQLIKTWAGPKCHCNQCRFT